MTNKKKKKKSRDTIFINRIIKQASRTEYKETKGKKQRRRAYHDTGIDEAKSPRSKDMWDHRQQQEHAFQWEIGQLGHRV